MFRKTILDVPTVVLVDEAAAAFFGVRRSGWAQSALFPRRYFKPFEACACTLDDGCGRCWQREALSLDEIEVPHIYESMYQYSKRDFGVLVRAIGDKAALTRDVRREIQTVDPDCRLRHEAMTDLISRSGRSPFCRVAAWSLRAGSVAPQLCGCLRDCLPIPCAA